MWRFLKIQDLIHSCGKRTGRDPRRVRALPEAVPHSPLEDQIWEVLTTQAVCPWDHMVAVVAQHLRQAEHASRLAALDEGFWGDSVWSAEAQKELYRLEGVLIRIEMETASATGVFQRPDRS